MTSRIPYIVDSVDCGFDQGYASDRYKAHGVIADELSRYALQTRGPS